MSTVVIGVGNRLRGDDGAGPEVAARLRERVGATVRVVESSGDPTELIDAWRGTAQAVVVDAAVSGAPVGTIHHIEVGTDPIGPIGLRGSSHLVGLDDAIALAGAIGELPGRLTIVAIEGEIFWPGRPLSPAVEEAVAEVTALLAERWGRMADA